MALPRNKLIPVLGAAALALLILIGWRALRSDDVPVQPGKRLASVPTATAPASAAGGMFAIGQNTKADGDRPNETLATLTARLADNDRLNKQREAEAASMRQELDQLKATVGGRFPAYGGQSYPNPGAAAQAASGAAPTPRPPARSSGEKLERTFDTVVDTFDAISGRPAQPASRSNPGSAPPNGMPPGLGFDGMPSSPVAGVLPRALSAPSTSYTTIAPLGYEDRGDQKGKGARFVRSSLGSGGTDAADSRPVPSNGTRDSKDELSIPYFTVPENATLTRVVGMTVMIGRIPLDGKVQDPFQFKAIIGRENIAANGQYVPDDISGIVVSGTAVGDMAMSCSEGHVYSMTFIFNDGAIRTISNRKGATGASRDKALGWISDEWGNPCIAGRFVTNAPAYLTDVVGLKTLSTASKAYAAAQTSTTDNALTGNSTSSVTGNRGAFVLGQAAASGVDEVSNWIFSRLKNSFDAVVVPPGQRLLLHIDQELAIDRVPNQRRLDHTSASAQSTGARHGLD